ncbi:MAG: phage terminase large subunit [Provencibacterium sp.]|jgi:predicted phage terminase large subunit-like protein|nr:phage terminase large subunit [Provencibacterium sp.]
MPKKLTPEQRRYLADEAKKELARRYLLDFTLYTCPEYRVNWHHRSYAAKLDAFARGEIKKLMIFMPPQHGKSELCSRRLPAKLLGDNPDLRIGLVSYAHDFVAKFNRNVQRIIDTPEYAGLYPGTHLNAQGMRKIGTWLRNADEFEVVGRKGGMVTVGVNGGLTGRAVDTLIIDDPYKDNLDAWSPTIRRNVQDWYDTVANTRLHNDSQQLITLTRWHPDDLAGVLLRREPEAWMVVKFPAIKEGESTEYDPREPGEALWPERHSLERLLAIKKHNPHVFQSLYQQNPKPAEGLLFPIESLQQFALPDIKEWQPDGIIAVADVADTGRDYYCMLVACQFGTELYIVDAVYTQAQVEVTEPLTIGMLQQWPVSRFRVESNNGGRLFAKGIREKYSGMAYIEDIPTTSNKETRILTASGQIKEHIHFRNDVTSDSDYQRFLDHLAGYTIQGPNEHDDAPDAATMLIEAVNEQVSDWSLD